MMTHKINIGLISNSDPSNHIRVHLFFTHYIYICTCIFAGHKYLKKNELIEFHNLLPIRMHTFLSDTLSTYVYLHHSILEKNKAIFYKNHSTTNHDKSHSNTICNLFIWRHLKLGKK